MWSEDAPIPGDAKTTFRAAWTCARCANRCTASRIVNHHPDTVVEQYNVQVECPCGHFQPLSDWETLR